MNNFATVQTCAAKSTHAITANCASTDTVAAVLFDDLKLEAEGSRSNNQHLWDVRILDVHLTAATRRAFVLNARGHIAAEGGASASARISVGGQTTSREVIGRAEMRQMAVDVTLHIKRSSQPRDRLRVVLFIEANAPGEARSTSNSASAAFDSFDVRAN